MAEQIAQTLHDREAETKATTSFARGIIDLMELLKDLLHFLAVNADAGIPHLDAQHSRVPTAAQKHLALLGVFQCIRQQITHHLLQQARVAMH